MAVGHADSVAKNVMKRTLYVTPAQHSISPATMERKNRNGWMVG